MSTAMAPRPPYARVAALASCLTLATWAQDASADPQTSVGLTVGGGLAFDPSAGGAFHLGLRDDLLFGRERNGEWAAGPFVAAATRNFSSIEFGGGAAVLAPLSRDLPLVISPGIFASYTRSGWAPGASASVFLGSRSYNFHSVYGMAFGGFVECRRTFEASPRTDVLAGVQIDTVVLALPIIALVRAIGR
jgi:hypothetical protein